MTQQLQSALPKTVILNSDDVLQSLRKSILLSEVENQTEVENRILAILVGSMTMERNFGFELEYNCHYLLEQEVPELFATYGHEQKVRNIIHFGYNLQRMIQSAGLYLKGNLFYEFEQLLGASVVLDRLDVNRDESPKAGETNTVFTRPFFVPGIYRSRLNSPYPLVQVETKRIGFTL